MDFLVRHDPGLRSVREVKARLLRNNGPEVGVCFRKSITEGHPIVVRTQHDLQLRAGRGGEREGKLPPHDAVIAPLAGGRRVALVDRAPLRHLDEAQAGGEVLVGALEPERGIGDHLVLVADHAPDQPPVFEPRDAYGVVSIRGVQRPETLGGGRRGGGEEHRGKNALHGRLLYPVYSVRASARVRPGDSPCHSSSCS